VASVLIVQHVAPEPPGLIAQALQRRGVDWRVARVDRGEPVPRTLEADGLVVMGGPMGVYQQDRYPHLGAELQLLEDAARRGRPILGVCLGSQLLAAALGARVYPAPAKEIGWHQVRLLPDASQDPLFKGIARSFRAFHWHGDAFDLPAGAVPLARSALTRVQAFRAGGTAYGVLCHLEVDREQLKAMSAAFAGELAEQGIEPAAVLEGADRFLPRLREIGLVVFDRWAKLVCDTATHAQDDARA
jgi:GMP synthase (glutamine-hydrolysing)